ncbi:hypothetical protein DEU56DRAFT_908400 [Suillus clintonianus]|uniref:uncharacterized protein n=1 Tax=Suillus clintonianus TaxID=1904413 RepID=UPI001B87BBE6|nr:uncharacterized protein DEU56DRAFT_908400 [Suillus clintonianus]KAG2150763.1 hypothetical protein DEU56DRAFT_908400 [Suillus clintonianus]
MVPNQVKPHRKNVKNEFEVFLVEKGPLDCSEELAAVEGWEPLTHPEGSLFFYHPYKVRLPSAPMYPEIAVKLGKAVEKAYEEARNADIFLHPSVELALELVRKNVRESWGYYFADHERRVIFWSEDHKSRSLMNEVRGVERKSHIKYALYSQYWNHIQLFPNKHLLPEDVVVELKELVMHAQADYILLETPLVPFTVDQVTSLVGLIDSLMNSANKECEHSAWIAGETITDNRLSVSDMLVDFTYVDENVMIWVDEDIIWPRWSKFRDRLTTEWNEYALFSTVMLAVNISFLTVPSVADQSLVIGLTYLSTIFTIGSLTSTLFFVGQINDSLRGTTEEVAYYMQEIPHSVLGLEGLALMLSLPLGFLSWGMTLFTVVLLWNTSMVIYLIAVPILITIMVLLVLQPLKQLNARAETRTQTKDITIKEMRLSRTS